MADIPALIQESMQDYPTLYIFVLAALLVCLFLWVIAMRAARRRRGEKEALIAVLEHEKALRTQFQNVTQQLLIDTPSERLIEGLCCNIQMALEKQPDMQAAYDALPRPRRLIYALGYVIQDGRGALSEFFRKNGQPLTGAALEAVQRLVGGEYAEIFLREFEAFDEETEGVSFVKEDIAAADSLARALRQEQGETLYVEAKEYILANSLQFVDQ